MSGKSKTKWAQRPRRTSDYIPMKDRVKLLEATNSKLLVRLGLREERIERMDALLVAWVTSKRADTRWMTELEKALFDEGMKLVPPRTYVALEEKS